MGWLAEYGGPLSVTLVGVTISVTGSLIAEGIIFATATVATALTHIGTVVTIIGAIFTLIDIFD